MKKIISSFITFLFFFGLFSNAFAVKTNSVDIDDFTSFSVEQVQNTFSNALSQQQDSDNQTQNQTDNETDNVFAFSCTDYSIPGCSVMNFTQQSAENFYFYDIDLQGYNCFYRNKLFDDKNLYSSGITEYKIIQNSYMAVALFDVVNSAYMIIS